MYLFDPDLLFLTNIFNKRDYVVVSIDSGSSEDHYL